MYQRKSRQYCAAMLIVSVCLRLCMFLGLDDRLGQLVMDALHDPKTVEFLLFLETGQRVSAQPPEQEVLTVQVLPPQPTPVPTEVVYTPAVQTASAQELEVVGACSYSYDKNALLQRPTAMELSDFGAVLIIHSHTTESYEMTDGLTYEPPSPYRTLDESRNVIAVGEVLAQTLREHGVEVIHDRTVCDYPNYNVSYWNSLQRIEQWKQQHPNIRMVMDIHRDAVEDDRGQAVALLSDQQGVSAAHLMLVVGTNEGGLEHPDWEENLANALKLQSVLEGEYPGLCRKLDLRTERFNQHTAPGAILVEVGTNGNTLTQAKASAKLLADAVAKLLTLLQQNNGTLPDGT